MNMGMIKAALLSRSAIPPQYQRVEYLKAGDINTGCYINTLYGHGKNCDSISIDARFYLEQGTMISDARPFGARSPSLYLCYLTASGGGVDVGGTRTALAFSRPLDIVFKLKGIESVVYLNGSLKNLEYSATGTTGFDITIFQWNNSGAPMASCDSRLLRCYYFKLYDNGILVRNLVPCRRKSDNKPGMWDAVSKTFFTNVGTGNDFVLGPDVI